LFGGVSPLAWRDCLVTKGFISRCQGHHGIPYFF